jgi:hypothetical protein
MSTSANILSTICGQRFDDIRAGRDGIPFRVLLPSSFFEQLSFFFFIRRN